MQNMSDATAKSWKLFSAIIICNIKSRAYTNLEKVAENPHFCMQNMSDNIAKLWKLFSTIIICNIKSLRCTKLEKMEFAQMLPGHAQILEGSISGELL